MSEDRPRRRLDEEGTDDDGDRNLPTKKKPKRSSPDFTHVLYECGVSSFLPTKEKGDTDNDALDLSSTLITSKHGSILEPNVNPSSLRASIDGLLKEMHKNGVDVDNTLVLDSMETFIMNGEYCADYGNDNDNGNGNKGSIDNEKNRGGDGGGGRKMKKYELLWRMLLPTVVTTSKCEDEKGGKDTNADADSVNGDMVGKTEKTVSATNTTTTTTSSSSLIKILLRIDVLQPTLITCLFSKLQELAMLDQEEDDAEDDDGVGVGGNENENDSGKLSLSSSMDHFTILQEIPRLILTHIRWMDHVQQPKLLTQAALECLSMLCTMSGDDVDSNTTSSSGNRQRQRQRPGRNTDTSGSSGNNISARSILLDLISTLPDIIDDETSTMMHVDSDNRRNENGKRDGNKSDGGDGEEEEEEDTMTMILSTLRDVRIQDPTLLIPCLDAVSSLRLTTQEQMDSVIYDALEALESVEESWLLPALCKFLMQNVPRGRGGGGNNNSGSKNNTDVNSAEDTDLCQKVIDSFRKLRLGQENVIDNEENMDGIQYRNQVQSNSDSEALMIEALSQGFAYRSDLTNSLLQTIKSTPPSAAVAMAVADGEYSQQKLHGPSDIWLLLCCSQAPHNKPKVKSVFKSKAVSGSFYPDLIRDAIQGNAIALQSLFESSLLFIADVLVRSNESAARKMGAVFYECMFLEFDNRICRQDLIGQMIIHINSGSYEEVDVAMKVLMNIASSGIEGVTSLRIFLPFLTSLLDNVRNFQSQHIRRLFLLLFIVGMDGSCASDDVEMGSLGGGGGCDDVHIVIRKYLALPQVAMKHIGIIGAIAFAAACSNSTSDPGIIKEVILMLDMVRKNCDGKGDWYSSSNQGSDSSAPRTLEVSAMSIFFDELCLALKGKSLPPFTRDWIQDHFSSRLEEYYLADLHCEEGNSGSMKQGSQDESDLIIDKNDKALVNGTSKNPRAPLGDLRYNFDKEDCTVYLKLLSLYASEDRFKREILPQQLCPLLRLLAACCDGRFGGEGLSEIDALIGCPILIPNECSTGIDFVDLSEEQKWTTTACIFTAVNWCRELINCFVHAAAFRTISKEETQLTQLQEENRCKVTEKLQTLVTLEEELGLCASKCYTFQPPGTSLPRIPKEIQNLSNNRVNNDSSEGADDDDYEHLSSKMTADEKKAVTAIKKAKQRKEAEKSKIKNKALKMKAKYEDELAKISQSALIPFNVDVCLVLGFPEVRITSSTNSTSQNSATTSPAVKTLKVGGPLTDLLLRQLNRSIKALFASNSKKLPFLKGRTQDHTHDSINSIDSSGNDNPYNNELLKTSAKQDSIPSAYQFLDACISQEVFISVHEHLAAIAEIRGNSSTSNQEHDEEEIASCAVLLLRCITTLFEAEDLFHQSLGRAYLEMVVKQLADGELLAPIKKQKPVFSMPLLLKYTISLFELLEEIVVGGETNDLSFVVEGVNCLKTVLRRVSNMAKGIGDNNQNQSKCIQTMKLKISKLCSKLLQRKWHEDTNFNKSNIGLLVSTYLEFGSVPFEVLDKKEHFRVENFGRLGVITKIVGTMKELANTEGCKGPLESYPTCTLKTFEYYLSSALTILPHELANLFQSPLSKIGRNSQECLNVIEKLVSLSKKISDLLRDCPLLAKRKVNLLNQLKGGSKFIEEFVKWALPFLSNNFSDHEKAVINIIRGTETISRRLGHISSYGKRVKDANLLKEAPKVKRSCELFVHKTRSIMRKNGVLDALSCGNLRHRKIDGTLEEDDKSSESEDSATSHTESEGSSSEEE